MDILTKTWRGFFKRPNRILRVLISGTIPHTRGRARFCGPESSHSRNVGRPVFSIKTGTATEAIAVPVGEFLRVDGEIFKVVDERLDRSGWSAVYLKRLIVLKEGDQIPGEPLWMGKPWSCTVFEDSGKDAVGVGVLHQVGAGTQTTEHVEVGKILCATGTRGYKLVHVTEEKEAVFDIVTVVNIRHAPPKRNYTVE